MSARRSTEREAIESLRLLPPGRPATARRRGMRFYQHNHSGEFAVEGATRLH
jgi:hypothetical protein